MDNVIILNYHSILDRESGLGHIDPIYSLSKTSFEDHLILIKKLGLDTITINDIPKVKDASNLNVCLTFDDGHESDYHAVFPLLSEYDMMGSFFPSLSNIQNEQRWKEYRSMNEKGHLIGSHGISHLYFSNLSKVDQFRELKKSKQIIEEQIQNQIDYFALPGGKYNSDTCALAKYVGYKKLLTTDFGMINSKGNDYLLNRWSIKNTISLSLLTKILKRDASAFRKMKTRSYVKRSMISLLGNHSADKINYFINS